MGKNQLVLNFHEKLDSLKLKFSQKLLFNRTIFSVSFITIVSIPAHTGLFTSCYIIKIAYCHLLNLYVRINYQNQPVIEIDKDRDLRIWTWSDAELPQCLKWTGRQWPIVRIFICVKVVAFSISSTFFVLCHCRYFLIYHLILLYILEKYLMEKYCFFFLFDKSTK